MTARRFDKYRTHHDDGRTPEQVFMDLLEQNEIHVGHGTPAMVLALARRAILETCPDGNFPPVFDEGERVVLDARAATLGRARPGVVSAIDHELTVHHYLRVKFDDGEERQINPDVMMRERTP